MKGIIRKNFSFNRNTQEVFNVRHSEQVMPYPSEVVVGHDALGIPGLCSRQIRFLAYP